VDDWCNELWGRSVSPGIKSGGKRKAREEAWEERLERVDGKTKRHKRASEPSFLQGQKFGRKDAGNRAALTPMSPSSMTNIQLLPSRPDAGPRHEGSGKEDRQEERTSPPIASVFSRIRRKNDVPLNHSRLCDLGPSTFINDLHKGPVRPAVLSAREPTSSESLKQNHGDPTLKNGVSSISKFLSTSLVWFSRPCGSARPSWRMSCRQILPRDRRIYSLDSLLAGCGWSDGDSRVEFEELDKGVIFVDREKGDTRKFEILKILGERRAALACGRRRKPIWVFDEKLLGYESLEKEDGFDIEAHVLFVMG
jgi:hypothetical protein